MLLYTLIKIQTAHNIKWWQQCFSFYVEWRLKIIKVQNNNNIANNMISIEWLVLIRF